MSGRMGESFLELITSNVDDDATRLVFADWLYEQGEADRAEFIRIGAVKQSRRSVETVLRHFRRNTAVIDVHDAADSARAIKQGARTSDHLNLFDRQSLASHGVNQPPFSTVARTG